MDCFFIAYGGFGPQSVFAEARGIRKKSTMGVCSTITKVGVDQIVIESDIETQNKVLNINQRVFPELTEAESTEAPQIATKYPMTSTYYLKLPEFDPWADDTKISIPPDKTETWIDLHSDQFKEKKGSVLVVDAAFLFLNEVYELERDSALNVLYQGQLQETFNYIETICPELIFISNEEQDEEALASLEAMIYVMKKGNNYNPILILTNMPSSSATIQKLFNYNHIICYPGVLTGEVMKKFAQLYSDKKLINNDDLTYSLSTVSIFRTLDVNLDIIIQNLTEHEITFESSFELPMFANVHFLVPTEFYATLIPIKNTRPASSERITYCGLIHGISEKRLELFRQFINSLIINPDITFEVSEELINSIATTSTPFPRVIFPKKTPGLEETPTRFQGKSKL